MAQEAGVLKAVNRAKVAQQANMQLTNLQLRWSEVRIDIGIFSLLILARTALEELRKAGVCIRRRGQVIGQQGRINLGDFVGAPVILNDMDGNQAKNQGQQRDRSGNSIPPTGLIIAHCEGSSATGKGHADGGLGDGDLAPAQGLHPGSAQTF